MPWYAWYSQKQADALGYAHYLNKKGELVAVTEVNQDPEYQHPNKDAIKLGRVTHFCGVQQCNHGKHKKEPDKMIPPELEWDTKGNAIHSSLILN